MGGALPPPVAGTPTAPAAAATPAPAPVAVAEGTVKVLPERLQDIARPVVLTGTVVGTTPEGLARVRTQAGEVLLQTPTPLPADKPVTLQITPAQVLLSQAQAAFTDPAAASPVQSLAAKVLVLIQGTQATAPNAPASPTAPGPATTLPGQTGATRPQGPATPAVILPGPAPATPTTGPAGQPLPLLLPGTIVPALVIAAAPKAPAPSGAAPALPGQTAAVPAGGTPPSSPPAADGGAAPTAAPAAAPPQAPPQPPSAPAPSGMTTSLPGKPMLDAAVELGGDAAHPGGEPPAPASPAPSKSVPLQPGLPNPEAEPVLTQGGTVALKILTVTPPADQPQATPPEDGSLPPDGQNAGNPPRKDAAPPAPLPAPTQPRAAPAATPTDTGTPSPVPEAPDGPVLKGTVAGSTPQGQPIIATPQGMLALNVQASLPQGSTVTATLTDPAKALQTAPPPLAAELGPLSERDWPAMRQLLAALAGVDRSAAQSLIGTVMPQPNRKLGAALSFFLSAIRGGDARGWLGEEATSALEKSGQGGLLSQLEREFRNLQQQAGDPLPGDWRPYTLPMMDASGLMPIRLHIHPINAEEDGKKGRKGGGKGSRFLLDLDLSRLGPMQLDGLVQPNRFDLILRSHTPLAPELRLDLIQIFADSVRAVGYTGGLSFQSGAKCWVKLTRAGAGGNSYTA